MAPTPLHGPLMLRDLLVVPTCCTFLAEGLSRHPTCASLGPSTFVCAGGAWPPSDVVRVCGRRGQTHHSTSGSGHCPPQGCRVFGVRRGVRGWACGATRWRGSLGELGLRPLCLDISPGSDILGHRVWPCPLQMGKCVPDRVCVFPVSHSSVA